MTANIESLYELGRYSTTVRAIVVKVDETNHWAEEIQQKAKGKIYGIYLVDLTEPTHCCSLSIDYPAYFIKNHFENVEFWQDSLGNWLNNADELFELEFEGGVDSGRYFSEHSSFEVVSKVERLDEEFEAELNFIDDNKEKAHAEWIDNLIEYYNGNSPV